MREVEQTLKAWKMPYDQLSAAQAAPIRVVQSGIPDASDHSELRTRVAQLQQETEIALRAVDSAMQAVRMRRRA
jgi:hypothetical protein